VTAENPGLTATEHKVTFQEMMVAFRDSLSNLTRSDNGKDGEDTYNDVTESGKLSEYDDPGWVMDTLSITVQQLLVRFCKKQMKFDELTYPGWWEITKYLSERDKKYGTSELSIAAVM
jgi:hypothetical protein